MNTKSEVWFIQIVSRVLILGIVLGPSEANCVCVDDATSVRERIASAWHRLESVELRSVEIIDKLAAKDNSITTLDFSWKREGRSAVSWTRETIENTSYLDERDDGERYISSNFFATGPKAVRGVVIRPSRNIDQRYRGEVYSSFFMLLPGGMTVANLLDRGATLENTGSQRVPRWSLKYREEKFEIECFLDETHDYLPRELTFRKGRHRREQRVERFEQADGFWYPAEGTTRFYWASVNQNPARIVDLSYRVEKIAFNQPIDSATFTPREFPSGALVENQMDHTRSYAGGQFAHTKLMLEHPAAKQKVPTNEPIKVPADAGAGRLWWFEAVLIGIAVLAGSLGAFFRWRTA